MKPIIKVENLGKQYRIGARQASYETLRESLVRGLQAPFERLRGKERPVEETVWALKNVGFEVTPGDVVGIIGGNGAGKSTLLKILSQITEPTTGQVDIYGRVRGLLEVGTGFHPELTGRENVYLNGAILGMKRAEIARKFDEIVAFAEVARFLDTPVKRYSSGMYMRLAFAVAAHLEPEILLVDEVLAVGDANFQRRCLGRLEELGTQGRTVLFVSHNMPTVLRLCNRVILLEQGRLAADGSPVPVTRRYLHSGLASPAERVWPTSRQAPGDSEVRLHAVRVRDQAGRPAESLDIRRPLSVEVEYWQLQGSSRPTVSLWFINDEGVCLFVSNDFSNRAWWSAPRGPGLVRCTCRIPGNFLAEGRVSVVAAMASYNPDVVHLMERDAVSFQVVDRSDGDGVRGVYAGVWPGVVRPMLAWDVATDSGGFAAATE